MPNAWEVGSSQYRMTLKRVKATHSPISFFRKADAFMEDCLKQPCGLFRTPSLE